MGTITQAKKVLYTAKTRTTGARENGIGKSSDGNLDVRLSPPGKGNGTNPEQLFAVGWSACFEGALGIAAQKLGIRLSDDTAIDAEIDLASENGGYFLQARMDVSLPGMDRAIAQQLIETAHETCPYSKAIRGNVDVVFNLV